MIKGCSIWGAGLGSMACPADPDQLGKAWPSWAKDMDALAPWVRTPGVSGQSTDLCWVSGNARKETRLILTGSCSSAMDVAWHFMSRDLLPEWGSVLALNQRNGRGQMGREWLSPKGNIYSATHFPSLPGSWGNLFPLVVGHCLAESFAALNVCIQIKWPNDLVIENKKIGGILVEKKGDQVVVGVGINLDSSPGTEALRLHHVIPAASLDVLGYHFTPVRLWQDLMDLWHNIYTKIVRTDTPSGLTAKLNEHLAFKNRKVSVTDRDNHVFIATIQGLAQDGGLKLWVGNETKVIQAGSICPLPGSTGVKNERKNL